MCQGRTGALKLAQPESYQRGKEDAEDPPQPLQPLGPLRLNEVDTPRDAYFVSIGAVNFFRNRIANDVWTASL